MAFWAGFMKIQAEYFNRNRPGEHSEFFKSDFCTLNFINNFRARIFNFSVKKFQRIDVMMNKN